jgi:hypothetical protein
MIRTPTTLVVGAGASHPYGLPTGDRLREKAVRLNPANPVYQLLVASLARGRIGDGAKLNAVLEDLQQHPAPSIDEFLESRQGDPKTMKIGKMLIAALMGEFIYKRSQGPAPQDKDWLGYLINRMRISASTPEEFAGGNAGVRFITFNFDSVIEDRLAHDLNAIYGGVDVKAAIGSFPVLHLHGKLPTIPEAPMKQNAHGGFSPPWIDWLDNAAAQVNVVLDDIGTHLIQGARNLISEARVLCFLGFAYNPQNLLRLSIPEVLIGGGLRRSSALQ